MVFPAFAAKVQLVPDSTLFIHIFLILLMIWILNRTLFKPINRVLETREKLTQGRLSESQEILQTANEKLSNYEKALRGARSEGYAVVEESRQRALANRQTQINTVKEEVSQSMINEKIALQKQFDLTHRELESNAVKIAEQISATVLKRPLAG